MHIFDIREAKNIVNTCKYRWFWWLGSEKPRYLQCIFASGSEKHGIYNVIFLPGPSKNTGIYAVFSVLQDVVSIHGKHKKHSILRCFCFPATDKRVQTWLKNGHFGAYVRPSLPIVIHLGTMLAYLGAMLAHLGAMLAHLGAMLARLGAHLGPAWGYTGPTWARFGVNVGLP